MTTHRFLVIGCGSIGTRHLRNLIELGQHDLIAFDPDEGRRRALRDELPVEVVDDLESGWNRAPAAAIVATPTSSHLELALAAAARGCHFLVEKPLSDSLEETGRLAKLVADHALVSLVGCNMRFHPGVRALHELVVDGVLGRILTARFEAGQYLPDWRPGTDYRQSYSARSELGGGIVLDAIHELDYAGWLLGPVAEVSCFAGHVSDLEIDTEDVASMLLRFAQGALAEVHLDYVQRSYSRMCRLAGELGSARWDYTTNEVEIFLAEKGRWETRIRFDEWEPNAMYLDELRHFLRCLDGDEVPLADVEAGRRSLAIAIAAKTSAAERRVTVPEEILLEADGR
jgi:predicted dehydrogenase